MSDTRDGAERIAAERQRHISQEGWTPKHDDEHVDGELAWAAVCYAAPSQVLVQSGAPHEIRFRDPWPFGWARAWDKRPRTCHYHLTVPSPAQRIRMLEKAGALIAAEIDRLLRLAPSESAAGKESK